MNLKRLGRWNSKLPLEVLLRAASPSLGGAVTTWVNSARPVAAFRQSLPGFRVLPVDGLAISRRCGLGRIVNSALLGALAGAVGDPPLAVLQQSLREQFPRQQDENAAACAEGANAVEAQVHGALA